MAAVCPVCGAAQSLSLLCSACCDRLERALGDVASIVADLEITMSRQDKVPSSGGGAPSAKGKEEDAGLSAIAHTRTPINFGAVQAADNLTNVLTTWARDVEPVHGVYLRAANPASTAARMLLSRIDAIRRHPAVEEMVDEIGDAIAQARRVVDRPADRIYLGQCLFEEGDVTCYSEIWASPTASAVQCKVCGVTHPVTERRAWLLERASDMLFTVSQAAQMIGDVGGKRITEDRIRGYLRRGRIIWRPIGKDRGIRLGDLLDIVADEGEKKSA